jgi:hypothetical protein
VFLDALQLRNAIDNHQFAVSEQTANGHFRRLEKDLKGFAYLPGGLHLLSSGARRKLFRQSLNDGVRLITALARRVPEPADAHAVFEIEN